MAVAKFFEQLHCFCPCVFDTSCTPKVSVIQYLGLHIDTMTVAPFSKVAPWIGGALVSAFVLDKLFTSTLGHGKPYTFEPQFVAKMEKRYASEALRGLRWVPG